MYTFQFYIIICNVTLRANGSGRRLCAYIHFRTLWVTTQEFKRLKKKKNISHWEVTHINSVKKVTGVQDQKYFVKKKKKINK